MMFNFSWTNIRSYNNSQNNAFEELVCQLANEEPIEGKKSFTRVGAPDGGVECYCLLENGDEYGWQAKYFLSMGTEQWRQIEESFKRALKTHPRLSKYFICIPLDRQDPRRPDQNWFMDKWNENVKKWSEYANACGRTIDFEYWGSHELLSRLSRPQNAGRMYFWFNKDEFTDEWFSDQLQSSIDSLGERYTPEINVEVEIVKHFDGLARNKNFQFRIAELQDELLRVARKALSFLHVQLDNFKEELSNYLLQLESSFNQLDFASEQVLNFQSISDVLFKMENLVDQCIKKYAESEAKSRLSNDNYHLMKTMNLIHKYQSFLESPSAILSNRPYLILRGEAGIGKSHLLADIAKNRQEQGHLSLLLLGQHFVSDENPWTQILDHILRLRGLSKDEFLGALNAKAEANRSRIIVFIDAINEGRGPYFWKDYLRNFIRSFEKYKWLGLVISIRSSYEPLIANDELLPEETILRITHHGFAYNEYQASKIFFQHYNIQQPAIPLLHHEFRNPLFLKLFCEGLIKNGYTTIPEGYEGISAIIGFYIKGVNKRLSDPRRLDYPENINLVDKAIKLLIELKMERGSNYIPYEEAYVKLQALLRPFSSKNHFIEALISEGIIARNVFWIAEDQYEDGVYLAYERFADHFEANYLLAKYLDENNLGTAFSSDGMLYPIIKDEHTCYLNKGLLEALSIQLPEKYGVELYELATESKSFYPFVEAFVDSLVWRKSDTVTPKLIDYINSHVLKFKGTHDRFYEVLLLLAVRPNHYFNAYFLHNHLMSFTMADRDSWWTTYIHDRFMDETPIKRMVDWAWEEEDKSYISDESILLTSITLSWFLTSSNRFLRDSATKALVNLLQNRIGVLKDLLQRFSGINDIYVLERLYAVAYGCALRTTDKKQLRDLCLYIYDEIFNKEFVIPHILLRDYARGIIEYILTFDASLSIDVQRIRPPYNNKWNSNEVLDNIEISGYKFDYKSENFQPHYWSQNDILSSMATSNSGNYGDFGRYVFESGFSPWKDLDVKKISNWAIKRIFELGYDVEKHGEFDRSASRYGNGGRSGRKAERIGKKYQWIAFYELLALVSDSFPMYDDDYTTSWKKKIVNYEGPWNPYVRDIDPTMLIRETRVKKEDGSNWWIPINYSNWELDNDEWVQSTDDLPDPNKFLLVKDEHGNEWFILESYPEWSEPKKLGEDNWERIYKQLWYQFRSYLVPQNGYKKLYNWLSDQNFMGRWMPEAESKYQIFSREYYWSPAYKYFKNGDWVTILDKDNDLKIGKGIITTEHFLWEEEYDCSKSDSISYLKPSGYIVRGMNLEFGYKEGQFTDTHGNLICFDPSVYNDTISCLLIKKGEFLDFLQKNKLKIIWTFLGEKRILGERRTNQWLELSGAYYYCSSSQSMVGNYKVYPKTVR